MSIRLAGSGAAPSYMPAIQVENPGAAEKIEWFRTYEALTVASIDAVLNGSSSPTVTFSVRYGTDRSAAGTELLTSGRTVTSTTTGASYVPDVTTIPAGNWVWITTTAKGGTVLGILITMNVNP